MKSKCCNAPMTLYSGDEGTNHYKCFNCGHPCDPVDGYSWEKRSTNKPHTVHFGGKDWNVTPTTLDWERTFDQHFSSEWWKGFGWTDNIDDMGKKSIKAFIAQLLESQRKSIEDRFESEFGDFCHEQYLGCSLEDDVWHYSYKTEVIWMVDQYFKSLLTQKKEDR